MIKIDIVCPLYHAEKHLDGFLARLRAQRDVEIVRGVFPLTDDGSDLTAVKAKLDAEGFTYFTVAPEEFSHSLTRERAIRDYCVSDIVLMLSQDVILEGDGAVATLAAALGDGVVYAYGRQIVKHKTIEYYVRRKNYGADSFTVSKDDIPEMGLRAFFASDAFAAYDRPAFLALGGYDGIPMMMNEDMYYAKKLLDAGYRKAYVAGAVAEHSHRFTLKQLYRRYYATGVWFREHPEFSGYKTTDTGMKLALSVFAGALKHFNLPVLLRFLPDMTARYLGMKRGAKAPRKKEN